MSGTNDVHTATDYNKALTTIFLGREGPNERWLVDELVTNIERGDSDQALADALRSRGAVTPDSIAAGISRARDVAGFKRASLDLDAGRVESESLAQAGLRAQSAVRRHNLADAKQCRQWLMSSGASTALADHLVSRTEFTAALRNTAVLRMIVGGLGFVAGIGFQVFLGVSNGIPIAISVLGLVVFLLALVGWARTRHAG